MPGHLRAGHRIVAGVDGSPSSLAALRWAVRQAELSGGTVEAVIAWHYPVPVIPFGLPPVAVCAPDEYAENAEKALTRAINKVLIELGSSVQVSPRVMEGDAARVLLEAAAGADLLVVGSHGHGGFAAALLGSVSQHCAHHSPCPVVIVRGGGTPRDG